FGIYPLVTRSILNRLVPSGTRRATTLSIESLACRIAFCPIAYFAGWAHGSLGVHRAMAATALMACLPLAILPLIRGARGDRKHV
ncbi:MAG: hypothetical protein OER88_11350, partial [Planctomycetota bacterium]|nr:hypothetical protein [Planctomycetota bacterium]